MKLTKKHFEAIKKDQEHNIRRNIASSLALCSSRKSMEDTVFSENDVSEQFLENIKENWDCSDFDDSDLIEWIRDIQHSLISQTLEHTVIDLRTYIDEEFGSQINFASTQGVKPPQVTQWIDKGFVVINDVLYSPRRELKKP